MQNSNRNKAEFWHPIKIKTICKSNLIQNSIEMNARCQEFQFRKPIQTQIQAKTLFWCISQCKEIPRISRVWIKCLSSNVFSCDQRSYQTTREEQHMISVNARPSSEVHCPSGLCFAALLVVVANRSQRQKVYVGFSKDG